MGYSMIRLFLICCCLYLAIQSARADYDIKLAAQYQVVFAEGLLRSADITLVGLESLFGYEQEGDINPLIVHNSLNRYTERVQGLRALFTTDVSGNLKYDSFYYPTRPLNLRSRDYVKEAMARGGHDLFIGDTIKDKLLHFDSLPVSRLIYSREGHLKGVAVAVMTPDDLLERDKVCNKCIVSVFKPDGAKLVSFPANVQGQPELDVFQKQAGEDKVYHTAVNGLPVLSYWTKFPHFDLIMHYSYFE